MIKIIHYQVALAEEDMNKLKEKTGHTTAMGALTAAVEQIIQIHGSNKK